MNDAVRVLVTIRRYPDISHDGSLLLRESSGIGVNSGRLGVATPKFWAAVGVAWGCGVVDKS